MNQAIKIGQVADGKIPIVDDVEKKMFPKTFAVLIVAGLWTPTTIKSRALLACYRIYAVFCFVCALMLIITVLIDSFLSDDKSIDFLIEKYYLLNVFFNGLLRIVNLAIRRDKILRLLRSHIMSGRWQSPRNDDELAIVEKSRISEILVLKIWGSLNLANGISSWFSPIIHENPDNKLIFECYSPCDRRNPSCFWMAYAYQLFGYIVLNTAHVGVDCLIYNFIDRVNAHMMIFLDRLMKLPDRVREITHQDDAAVLHYENSYIRECIEDHHSIYESIEELNSIFQELVTFQFLSCISVLCTIIYFLSKQELFSPPFIAVSAFFCCGLTQNFFFCLYGNKLSQSSSEISTAIYGMDWQVLQKETKKKILFVMLWTSKEIALFNNAFVNLSLETFLKLLKVSYSAFNLLNQSTQK